MVKDTSLKERVMATNIKQITLDIAAPADWDGEKAVKELLEKHGLYVLGTNQEDLTEVYEKQGGFELLEKDGTYGEFSLKENIEENSFTGKIKVPGVAIVNSDGYQNGKESNVQIYSSIRECVDLSFEQYLEIWNGLVKNDELEMEAGRYVDSNENPKLSLEDYEMELIGSGYVLIQLDSYHIQFEFFEKELELNKEMFRNPDLKLNKTEKAPLDARIQETREILNRPGQTKVTERSQGYEK